MAKRINTAMTKGQARARLNAMATHIAQKTLGIETLDTRMSDRLDFHEVGVAGLKRALEQAFIAGMLAEVNRDLDVETYIAAMNESH